MTMLKGRQLAEAQASLRWFTVLATPAKWSIGGVLGLSEFSSAQITFLDAELIVSLKGKHHLGTSKPSHAKPSLLAWTNSSLATCPVSGCTFSVAADDFRAEWDGRVKQ